MSLSEKALLLKEDIDKVYDNGYNKGYSWGEEKGYHDGFNKGEDYFFHKVLLNGGKRTDIEYLFSNVLDASKYSFPEGYKPVYTEGLFYKYLGEYLPKGLDYSNITTSSTYPFKYLFYNCSNLKEIYNLNLGTKKIFSLNYTFSYCQQLVRIDTPLVVDSTATFTSAFSGCNKLEEVRFDGGLIGKDISFADCPNLSAESVKSLFKRLGKWTTESAYYKVTVTIKQAAFDRLVAAEPTTEWTNADGEKVQVTWAEYVDNKKWNLTIKS